MAHLSGWEASDGATYYFNSRSYQDRELLEAMQAQIAADPRGLNYTEINLAADGAGVRVRQVLARKLTAERGTG